ncbi:MAG: hypothetical protein ACYTG5_19085 [Planctomycetota bacterium]|jgi:hypothetical protein
MKPKDAFRFDCPCCGKSIEVNTRTGKARAVKFEESKKGKSFEGMVEDAKGDKKRLSSLLDEARELHSSDSQRLDDLFKQAKKKAAEDPDEKPRTPFDLD